MLNRLVRFLISFPPSDSCPFSSSNFSCNWPVCSPGVHVLPVHILWLHGDPAPSLPKAGGPYWNPVTDAGNTLQDPAKFMDVGPVESHILLEGRMAGSCMALDMLSFIFSMVSSFSSCLLVMWGVAVFPGVAFDCWSWKSMRFLVRRWSISSLKQPRAASAR